MKISLDHLPHRKQRELARIVEVLHEEFEDALKEGTAEFKKRGRILKIILFGSYARGTWVDEPHTKKGYKSDYDLLIIVNNKKLTDFATYWHKAQDRLMHLPEIQTPVSLIVHSRREVNTALYDGQYFFVDIRRDGIVLYQLDDEPLAEPKQLTAADAYEISKNYFFNRSPDLQLLLETAGFQIERARQDAEWRKHAAFTLHQAIERSYSVVLLTLTSYAPPSHNLKHLRQLAEDRDHRLVEIWPRGRQRYSAWFNAINEAYVKARYSDHYEISQEGLEWLVERAEALTTQVKTICKENIKRLRLQADKANG
ncbi:nucleotidyltransferase and HEPN domain-containing protein [Ciceribacter thiooxidans]|uniref:Nucleotidyltransferase and HEPN domain-containing protein n=1 Tax=Ciceribacter thiooxidans TaxID=1969821 RepID=A0ABV7HZI9_9HYPH|nr:nucleotidyltransferase and HEPN domain-containing protein [Ciceribacter thiooxidans]